MISVTFLGKVCAPSAFEGYICRELFVDLGVMKSK